MKAEKIKKLDTNHTEFNENITRDILNDMKETVIKSFGPMGASTLIVNGEKESAMARITKDGFTLLSNTKYFHPASVALKRLVLDSMIGVLRTASDGTTTTTILIAELYDRFEKIYKEISKEYGYPRQVFQNIGRKVIDDFKNAMDKYAKDDKASLDDIIGIIETSTNNDEDIVPVLVGAVEEITNNGTNLDDITITYKMDGLAQKTKYEIKDGYNIPNGPVLFPKTTMNTKVNAVIIDPSVATADTIKALAKFIYKITQAQLMVEYDKITPLIIITYNIGFKDLLEKEIAKIYMNYYKAIGTQINPPVYVLEYRHDGSVGSLDEHRDFEFLLGQSIPYELTAKNIGELFPDNTELLEDKEMAVDDFILYMYVNGHLSLVDTILTQNSVTFTGFRESTKDVLMKKLEDEINNEVNIDDSKVEAMNQRMRRISGKYAEITIGGENEWDIKRKSDAVEDAVGAIKAAIKSTVCGGLSTYIRKVFNDTQSLRDNVSKIYYRITMAILASYETVTTSLLLNAGVHKNELIDIEDRLIRTDLERVEKKDKIRACVDIRSIIDIYSKEEKLDVDKIITMKVLNTVDAEKRILEAAGMAALTLININQITMQDQYDIAAYNDGAL